MTTKDAITRECFSIASLVTARGKATLKQDEEAYKKWDSKIDKAILELVRLIRDATELR